MLSPTMLLRIWLYWMILRAPWCLASGEARKQPLEPDSAVPGGSEASMRDGESYATDGLVEEKRLLVRIPVEVLLLLKLTVIFPWPGGVGPIF